MASFSDTLKTMIIDPKQMSDSQILANLEAYVESRPEAVRGFYSGSTGQIHLELLAGVLSYQAYQAVVGRRENYIQYARGLSSLIGLAQNMGYSVFRGKNPKVKIDFIANSTQALSKYSLVGTFKDQDLILMEDVSFMSGQQVVLYATVGILKTVLFTYRDSDLIRARFDYSDITEDYRLSLQSTEVSFSTSLVDLLEGKFVCLTNAGKGLDVFYLNEPRFGITYNSGDVLKLEYIARYTGVPTSGEPNFLFGDILDYTAVSLAEPFQSTDSIRMLAPIQREVSNLIRGRNDWIKILQNLNSRIASANGRDVDHGLYEASYVLTDSSFLKEVERKEIVQNLNKVPRQFGVMPLQDLKHPTNFKISFLVTLTLLDFGIREDTIKSNVRSIVTKWEKKLGVRLDLKAIEHLIERFPYVKTARMSIITKKWRPKASIFLGEYRTPTGDASFGVVYEANLALVSGAEPEWIQRLGAIVYSNGLAWRAYRPVGRWPEFYEEGFEYFKGAVVSPTDLDSKYAYELLGPAFRSSHISKKPEFVTCLDPENSGVADGGTSGVGLEIIDNDLLWRSEPAPLEGESLKLWQADTVYSIGDTVIPIVGSSLVYVCTNYIIRTGEEEPKWPTLTTSKESVIVPEGSYVFDNKIKWIARAHDDVPNPPNLAWDQYYTIDLKYNIIIEQAV